MKKKIGFHWARPLLAMVCLAGVGVFGAMPAQAAALLTVTVLSSSAAGNTTGNFFDVNVTNISGSAVNIAAFNFKISVTDTDISFDAASTNMATAQTYIFAGDSFDATNSFPLASLSGAQTLLASDLTNSGNNVSVGAGATLGLGHIFYNVANGATPGVFTVTLAPGPADTSFSDAGGNPQAFSGVNGTITITSGPTVPEPSAWLLLMAALPALFLVKRYVPAKVRQ